MPSSVIQRMVYDPVARVLIIDFRGGHGAYRYFDVPMREWMSFRASGSKGTYLNEVFKDREYRYEKLVVRNEEREQDEDSRRERDSKLLRWPGPEPGADGSDADDTKADDFNGLTDGHAAAPRSVY